MAVEKPALDHGLKAAGEQTEGMNYYYRSIFLHVLIMEVLSIVIGNNEGVPGKFGEGGKMAGSECQELIFAHAKFLNPFVNHVGWRNRITETTGPRQYLNP